mgnify:CR=1 FL=1
MSKEKKVEFEVEKTNERNVILIAKSDAGTTRTSIYLWPKEIFDEKSCSTSISVNKTKH